MQLPKAEHLSVGGDSHLGTGLAGGQVMMHSVRRGTRTLACVELGHLVHHPCL